MTTEIEETIEELTGHLRWMDGVLQQRWKITHYQNGFRYKYTEAWRDVPSYSIAQAGNVG